MDAGTGSAGAGNGTMEKRLIFIRLWLLSGYQSVFLLTGFESQKVLDIDVGLAFTSPTSIKNLLLQIQTCY